ncbi:hypothetical protein [Paludisphaera soli]|uniref:hypothetical protein n=1 Tax=Paludisphaera soli TaxID=2712865 RepID=UPI0013EA19CC|nr:hypothetical protein [Paludisphaera soli]
MRAGGASPQAVSREARREGLDAIARIRLLRSVYAMPFREAVELDALAAAEEAAILAAGLERRHVASHTPTAVLTRELDDSDFRPMSEFPWAWMWTDPRWNVIPPERLSRIRPLAESRAIPLHDRALAFFHALHLRSDLFSQIARCDDPGDDRSEAAKGWLRGLPPAEEEAVIVHFGREGVVLTDWATVCDYWDDLNYATPHLIAWPISEEWTLHHHDDRLTFGMRAGLES